jgi:cytochrome b561
VAVEIARPEIEAAGSAAQPERYTTVARVLHWLVALLVVAQFSLGWGMQEIPKTPPGPRADAYNVHKSVGMVIFALMALRIVWRARHPPPPWPGLEPWKAGLARIVHAALYASLLVLPLTGYLGSVFSGYPVKFLGMPLPGWGSAQPDLKALLSSAHLGAAWLLAAAFAIHLAGAAHHALSSSEGMMGRMGWRRRRNAPPAA